MARSYETTPVSQWSNNEFCSFIKYKKIGNQNCRVIPMQKAKKIIQQIKQGVLSGKDFAALSPDELKNEFGLNNVTIKRWKFALKAHQQAQMACKFPAQVADFKNQLPSGELNVSIFAGGCGQTDNVIAYGYWNIGELMLAIKRKCVVPSRFSILIAGKMYGDSDAYIKLQDTALSATKVVRIIYRVCGGGGLNADIQDVQHSNASDVKALGDKMNNIMQMIN